MPFVVYSKTAAAPSIFIHKNFVESRSPRVYVSPIPCALCWPLSPTCVSSFSTCERCLEQKPRLPPSSSSSPAEAALPPVRAAFLSTSLGSLIFPLPSGPQGGRADKLGSLLPLLLFLSLRTKGWLASGLRSRERAIGRPPQGRKERVLFPLCEDRRLRRRPAEKGVS